MFVGGPPPAAAHRRGGTRLRPARDEPPHVPASGEKEPEIRRCAAQGGGRARGIHGLAPRRSGLSFPRAFVRKTALRLTLRSRGPFYPPRPAAPKSASRRESCTFPTSASGTASMISRYGSGNPL